MQNMNIHTSKYKCSECGKCCQNNQKLKRHSRIHSGEKPFKCNDCNKRFTTARELVVHSRIHSGEKETIQCHVCYRYSKKLLTDFPEIWWLDEMWARYESLSFWDASAFRPGFSISFFLPIFQYGEIGRFQTLNRITQKVVDLCSFNFWEVLASRLGIIIFILGLFWIQISIQDQLSTFPVL